MQTQNKMNIVFFAHPSFLGSQSMPRYTNWLAEGMKRRGHHTVIYQPVAKFHALATPNFMKKWMGYIDQYIFFPRSVKARLANNENSTLYVFTDHAQGPWVPLVKKYSHIVHCHDFLAQRSALKEIKKNPVGWTGRIYQQYIRSGYRQADNFISISTHTQEDLHRFLTKPPRISEVVYNGLSRPFSPSDDIEGIRRALNKQTAIDLSNGYVLHIGGNQWYKNRIGAIYIYNAWRKQSNHVIPLLMVGASPSEKLRAAHESSPFKQDIHFLTGKDDVFIENLYAAASIFLFPSIAEGFGWPIAEAMASGCPVITTKERPMSEVGGEACFYLDVMPHDELDINQWAARSADIIEHTLQLSPDERQKLIKKGLENVKRFDSEKALDSIEDIYLKLLRVR